MVTAEMGHPPAEKLVAFGLGRLDDAESAAIETHLSTCTVCQEALEDAPADSLVETLREPAPAVVAKPADARPGLFGRLADVLHPGAAKPVQSPAPERPPVVPADVPAELQAHPRYEILERVGVGGMGTVFKARHRLMERVVALKIMNPKFLASRSAGERFAREVKAAAQLIHPHIVTAYDAERVGELHFLVMEYVEGQTLAEVVTARGPLPVHQACEYVRQAALGLQCAHEHQMVHRDIKPQNLVLTETGQVKVFDFGLARFVSESGERGAGTAFGKMMGSPDYMAPEQAKDPHSADIRADIYGLGCTLYHLLTGAPPFPSGSAVEKLSAHLEKTPLAITKLRPDLPAGLQDLVDRLLAKDPAQRFQTPADVAAALRPYCLPPAAVQPARRVPDARRRRVRWAAAVALLLGFAVVGLLFGGGLYRVVTNQGVLVIETDDPDVEVIVKQGGEQVTIVDTKTRREVKLKAGEYQLELTDGKGGLKLSTTEFRLTRGGRQIARVSLEPKPTPPEVVADDRSPVAFELPPGVPPAVEILELRALVGHRSPVVSVAFSPDGRYVLSSSQDKTVRLWDVASGKEVRRYAGFAAAAHSVGLSPDGAVVAAAGDDGVIHLWAVGIDQVTRSVSEATGQRAGSSLTLRVTAGKPVSSGPPGDFDSAPQVRQLQGHSQGVTSVAFSPDGRRLLSGGADTTVRLWDVDSGRQIKAFTGHQGEVRRVAFSPDGRLVASGSRDKTVRLWDVETGQQVRLFDRHTQPVNAVVFAPSGREIFSGAVDRTIRRWDVKTGVVTGALFPRESAGKAGGDSEAAARTSPADSAVHLSGIWPVALSPDGRWALSGSGWDANLGLAGSDYRVRLYDVASGWEIGRFEGHTGPLQSVAFSPDGRLAASGSHDKTVRILWLGAPGRAAAPRPEKDLGQLALADNSPALPVLVKRGGRLATVLHPRVSSKTQLEPGDYELELAGRSEEFELSADSVSVKPGAVQTLAIRKVPPTEKPPVAEIREVRAFKGDTAGVTNAVFSPDGRRVLACGIDNCVRVWDVTEGREVSRFTGHTENVWSLAVSPDGIRAVSAGGGDTQDGKPVFTDFSIRLWEVGTGKEIRTFSGHTYWVCSLAYSPNGSYVASGSGDGTVRLWDVNTARELRQLSGHEGAVSRVVFSPDNRRLLSCDALVRLWDVETGAALRCFDGHTDLVLDVAFSPDGRLVLSGSMDRTMRLWDTETGQELRSFRHAAHVVRVAFSPDGRRVLSTSGEVVGNALIDDCVRLWDVMSGEELARFDKRTNSIRSVAFSPDGRQAVTANGDNTVRLLQLPDPPRLPITEIRRFAGHTAAVPQAVFSPDGRHALSRSSDCTLRLWDVTSGKEVRRFEGYDEHAGCIAFSSDGQFALSGSWGRFKDGNLVPACEIRLWDVATGKETRCFLGHTSSLRDVAFTPDGRQVVSASNDSTLRLWDVQTGRQLRVFQGHDGAINDMALSTDGRHALSGGQDKTVRLWDVTTGRELRRLEGHTEPVYCVAISPDGRRALSCGSDRTIRLWDLSSGRQLRLFPGHPLTVAWVAFSPDGQRTLSGSVDRTVRLWDVATGQELGRFDGFADILQGVAFSPDGQSALACGADATLRLLKLPAADDSPKPLASGDTGQLVLQSEAADGWLLVKQRDKVVQLLDATANQTVDLSTGEYQLELAGRTENLRLSADKLTLAKGAKQVVQVRRESKPARVELTEVRSLIGHLNSRSQVRVSPDGRHVLSCGRDNTVRLLDVITGNEVRRFEGHVERLACAAFSPDGRLVAGGGDLAWKDGKSQESDFSVWLWDVATGKLLHRFEGHTAVVLGAAISPNGQCLVTGSWDGTVRLWDIPGRRPGHVLQDHRPVNAVAISPDGRSILSGGHHDTAVRLWDAQLAKALLVLEGHVGPVESVAFSPDGNQALSAGHDRTMRLWDVKNGRLQYAFPPQPTALWAAFSPDGKRIVSVNGTSFGHRVRLWDVNTKEEIGAFDSPTHPPWRTDWSSDGRFVACTGRMVRLLWLSETGGSQQPARDPAKGQLVIETNGFDLPIVVKQPNKLMTVVVPKVSKFADLPPGEYELELVGQPEDFRLSADKVTVATGRKQTVSIVAVPLAKPPHEITELRRFEGHTADVQSVVFSPDGRRILSGSQDKTVRLWEVETGKAVRQFEGNTQVVFSVAFSPDGRQALSAGADFGNRDFAIRLWDVDTGQVTRRFTGHTDKVQRAAFSPDGSQVASCSIDRTVRVWDVKTGNELQQFEAHENAVFHVAFAPDGRRVLSCGGDPMLRLWDTATAKKLRHFEGHTEWITGAAFSPDGRQAVSCAFDRSLRLWDVETGRQIRSFSGCQASENMVTFSPEGRRILSGSGWGPGWRHAGFDNSVRLRDVATGAVLACFEGHTGPVVTVAFSPDGRTALSAGCDNIIRQLQLPE